MFAPYNDDEDDYSSSRGGDESGGTRTPTEHQAAPAAPASAAAPSSSSLAASLQASHLLASGFDTASPASSSSSSTPSNYTIDSLASARSYLIENQEQLYNASTARRTSLPITQRPYSSSLLNSSYSLNYPNYARSLLYQSSHRAGNMYQDRTGLSSQAQLRGVQPPQGGFQCPNCSKVFARDDLLRRHLTREARAQAQPAVDRQKSCHECARSKSRCDLEVPTCGRCKARGKPCVYGARSGNPNMRRSLRETQEPSNDGPSRWRESSAFAATSQWTGSPDHPGQASGDDRQSVYESESDDSRQWVDPFQQYRIERSASTSSASTNASYDPNQPQQLQTASFDSNYAQSYHPDDRSASASHYNGVTVSQAEAGVPRLARAFSGPTARGTIDTNVTSSALEDEEATPINRTNAASLLAGATAMGPPHITPGRHRDTAAIPFGQSYWDSSAMGSIARASDTQRPQPPKLLTGAKMPQPPNRLGADPMSARPLFSAQLDLSGWLEEPVIPSPLYRMGPTLSALAPPTPTRNNLLASPSAWTGGGSGGTAEALRSALSATHMPLPVVDTVMAQQHKTADNNIAGTESHVAARQWWAHASDMPQNDAQSQGVAQACAGHFTVYPALMVLPEATSPVPPLFHRPWLASSRLHTPASLARARVLLAGYHVKLPSSEGMVWDMIANEVNALVASFDQHLNASDLDVFSTTAALWFLVILLLMSKDPSSGANVSDAMVDSSLIGLSQFSRLLAQRINACEERKRAQGHSPSFLEWGFEETMKRTLFASYALLVLQRFRETSTAIQSQLAGIDLILIVPLPAPAMEFEAGNELEWRAAQAVQISEPTVDGISQPITIRHLLNARKEVGQNTKEINQYFDRHDDFTNVCLSVAFALDREIS